MIRWHELHILEDPHVGVSPESWNLVFRRFVWPRTTSSWQLRLIKSRLINTKQQQGQKHFVFLSLTSRVSLECTGGDRGRAARADGVAWVLGYNGGGALSGDMSWELKP